MFFKKFGLSDTSLMIEASRPVFWEFSFLAQVLLDEIEKNKSKILTEEIQGDKLISTFAFFMEWTKNKLNELNEIQDTCRIVLYSMAKNQKIIFGPTGQPGNPVFIAISAMKLAYIHRRAIEWSQIIKKTPIKSSKISPVVQELSLLSLGTATGIEKYGPKILIQIDKLIENKKVINVFDTAEKITLDMNIDIEETDSKFFEMINHILKTMPVKKQAVIESQANTSQQINNNKKNSTKLTFVDAFERLFSLVGLDPVKNEIKNLVNLIKINNIKKQRGLPSITISNHLIFYGNPGTGKTTVARLIAEIYKNLGVLTSGHLIETDRSGLVAGYVGQTSLKVKEVVDSALGGVLFIDEAYTLYQSATPNDFGKEAIEILLKLMEDNRDDFIVIAAGYPEKMNNFLNANPGFRSRFNKILNFPDYSPDELLKVFENMSQESGLILADGVLDYTREIFLSACQNRDESFGNARFVRNFLDDCVACQANRLINLKHIENLKLQTITREDVNLAASKFNK